MQASDPPVSDQPAVQAAAQPATPPALQRKRHPALVVAVVSLVGLVWLAISVRNWMGQTREDLGGRIIAMETRLKTETEQFATAVARVEDANARLVLMEERLKESAAQQQSLEQLYKSLLRSRDETTLVEVEQLINLAAQQLRLLGNIEAAILALQQAESRLGSQDRPGATALRQAIGRDLTRLRSLPRLDLVSLAQSLDEVLRNLDRFPLLSDVKVDAAGTALPVTGDSPASVASSGTSSGSSSAAVLSTSAAATSAPVERDGKEGDAAAPVQAGAGLSIWQLDWWVDAVRTVVQGAWSDIVQLVRVRQVDYPDAMMMSPSQAFFVRENLRLRLLNARLALLSRQQRLLRDDLLAADEWLRRYFDANDVRVAQAQKVLGDIRKVDLAFEMPNLQDSISALGISRRTAER